MKKPLTPRHWNELVESTRFERAETRQQDAAVTRGIERVAAIFPHDTVSIGPLADLANAYATIERNRTADTDPDTGMVAPQPMTQSVLQGGAVDGSVADLPRRPGSFRLDFAHRCNGDEPLYEWNDKDQRWYPREQS